MILVTGATGTVGRNVVRELHESGCRVRALCRHPEKAGFPSGVETVSGDLTRLDTLRDAFAGAEKLFWALPQNPDYGLPELAKQAGVRHIVLLSSLAIEFGRDNAIAQMHEKAEQAIRDSGLYWTFLRPGGFMANALQWAPSIRSEGAVRTPFGDKASSSIDSRDIAAVAAEVLRTEGHAGSIYSLTGPELLSPRDQVRIIGELLGREIEFVTFPDEEARGILIRHMPEAVADAVIDLNKKGYADILPTVEQITGRAPFTFRQWASDHIDAFRQA